MRLFPYRRYRLLNVAGMRGLVKSYLHTQLGALFDFLCCFVMAHDNALKHVCGLALEKPAAGDSSTQYLAAKQHHLAAKQLQKEVLKNTKGFEQFADAFMHDYPSIMLAIKIKAGARVMLALQRKETNRLEHLGLLNGSELERIQTENNVSMSMTSSHPVSANVPEKVDIIRDHHCSTNLSWQMVRDLALSCHEKYYTPESEIKLGNRGWMMIVSGSVRVVRIADEGDEDQDEEFLSLLGVNSIVGAFGVLTGHVKKFRVIAQSFVQLYSWSADTSRKLMIIHPPIAHMMWQSVVVFVCETFPDVLNQRMEKDQLWLAVRSGTLWSHPYAKFLGENCQALGEKENVKNPMASRSSQESQSSQKLIAFKSSQESLSSQKPIASRSSQESQKRKSSPESQKKSSNKPVESGSFQEVVDSQENPSVSSQETVDDSASVGGQSTTSSDVKKKEIADPERIHLANIAMLITGDVVKLDGEQETVAKTSFCLLEPGSYLCSEITTIFELPQLQRDSVGRLFAADPKRVIPRTTSASMISVSSRQDAESRKPDLADDIESRNPNLPLRKKSFLRRKLGTRKGSKGTRNSKIPTAANMRNFRVTEDSLASYDSQFRGRVRGDDHSVETLSQMSIGSHRTRDSRESLTVN